MITSFANNRIKYLIQLSKKSKTRNEDKVFIIEGIKLFEETPRERIREIYVSESFYNDKDNKSIISGFEYELVSDNVFDKMSDTITPQGILCVVSQLEYSFEDIVNAHNPNIVILENIQDPGNLGTIIRSAEGAGISGIIITRGSADIYQPKVIRSTMGSIYRVPFIYVDDIELTIRELRKKGIRVLAAHLGAKKDYFETNISESSAILIGNEGKGLKEETANLADEYVKIPMEGKVESLNASVAASLLMYEMYRQRK